jgi:DNA primase
MKDTEKFESSKYLIKAKFRVEGVVEKHDVIGAIFGQTEGLFPREFELRELQKSGKIGRIDITLKSAKDLTTGEITAPSSLDRAETAIIAAAMETVDRVGPCEAKIEIANISDVRSEKRSKIVSRAKELMRDWVVKEGQDIEKLLNEVSREDKKIKAVHYGRERLTATPDISKSKEIIVVEGRADVNNLIKNGISSVIALEGVKIPNTIKNLAKKKTITAFLDGDRGGDLILQEMLQVAPPKWVARAPRGKEVEELTSEEILEALKNKEPIEESVIKSEIATKAQELKGTLEAVLLKQDGSEVGRIPVSELVDKLKERDGVDIVVFDGIVTGRLIDTAKDKNISSLIGERVAEGIRIPRGLSVKSFRELSKSSSGSSSPTQSRPRTT